MFKKISLSSKIRKCKKKIKAVEKKRIRSQAALVEAILTNTVPDDTDVDYFNQFTAQIDAERAKMHEYQNMLNQK